MDKWLCGVMLAGVLLAVGLPALHALTEEQILSAGYTKCNTTAENGTIVLPPSLSIQTCNITVQRAPGSEFTTIVFSRLELMGNDSLTVFDGDSQLLNVTGNQDSLVVVVMSAKALLMVQIRTDNSSSVLQATYNTTGCNIQQTVNSNSMVQSPVYRPNQKDFNCTYMVDHVGSSNTKLALSFIQVSLQNATLNVTSPSPYHIVNGTQVPPDMYSSGPIHMNLTVPKSGTRQTFLAAVTAITASSVCGQVQEVGSSLSTISLTVPASQPLPYDCRVTLSATKGKSVWLNITGLQLQGGGDSVEVVDGASLAEGNTLAAFTADTSGYLVLSGHSQVLVRLVLGLRRGGRSLNISVKALDSVSHMYNAGNFEIAPSSGKDMDSQYYLLEVLANSTVKFILSETNGTHDSTVSVYDGDQVSSPLLVTFSAGQRVPVVSSGSKMLVVASLSNTSLSLNASFSTQPPGCDKITSQSEGTFQLTSPSVPPKCQWTVTAPPNSNATILLDMTAVELSQDATLSVFSGVAGSEDASLVARLANVSSVSSPPLPSVAVLASDWAQVVWSSGNSTNLTSVAVSVRFQLRDKMCGGDIKAAQGHLRSPGFPNLYPLNAMCQWTFPPAKPGRLLFFDFPQFQLAQNHSVVITEKRNGSSVQVASFNGSAQLPDLLYASNTTNTITFSAHLPKSVAVSNKVAQGFDIRFWTLMCGGFTNQSKGSFSTPGYPAQIPISPDNATLCVWFVQLPEKTGSEPNVVNFTLQAISTGAADVNDVVKVYDGNTMRHGLIELNNSKVNNALSRYNLAIIVFNFTSKNGGNSADPPKLALRVNYTTFSCNMTCTNGLCMHPDWRCNEKDDCGDNSDEQNCISPPAPVNPPTKKGMRPGIVVVLFFVALFLGILLAIVIPRIIRRFRTNRYSTFRDDPPVA
ncbi:uncharacterized protein LOC143289822 isoform X2 [Babylonia areolata]